MARQAGTVHVEKCRDFRSLGSQKTLQERLVSVILRTSVLSLSLDKLMCDMGLRRWLATLTRRKPFGTTVPRPAKHPSEPVFSAKKWLKTPDIWRFLRCRACSASNAIPTCWDCSCRRPHASCTSSNDPAKSRSDAPFAVAITRLTGAVKPPSQRFSTLCEPRTPTNRSRG
jgi:hypothetical protein